MIKFGIKNVRFLKFISKIPLLKHFFILRITNDFYKITDERILNKFYTDIYVDSKTSKKTEKNRFEGIDKISLKFMNFPENIIHDIAVSSGITSLDFYNILKQNNINFQINISDKFSKINIREGFITKVYDSEHNFIFGYFGCLYATDKNIFFPLTTLLFKFLKRLTNSKKYKLQLFLFHPEIIKKISEKQIQNIDYDIFTREIENKFTFVRSMNILNKIYFTDNQIIYALEKIKLSLLENGILLVGRTDETRINNATFFQKRNNKFIVLQDVNSGSEIKDLILKI
jgi:hypothetical protein